MQRKRNSKLFIRRIEKSLAAQENVTEKMNAENTMEWVRKMNNIRNRAAEIVNNEVIFK